MKEIIILVLLLMIILLICMVIFLMPPRRRGCLLSSITFNNLTIEGIMSVSMTKRQLVPIELTPVDRFGDRAAVEAGSVKFTSSDESVFRVEQDPDNELKALIIAVGLGVARLDYELDADLDKGSTEVRLLSGFTSVEVKPTEAIGLGFITGVAQDVLIPPAPTPDEAPPIPTLPETPVLPVDTTPTEPIDETPALPVDEVSPVDTVPTEEPVAEVPTEPTEETPTDTTPEIPAEPIEETPAQEPILEDPVSETPTEEPIAEVPTEPANKATAEKTAAKSTGKKQ